MIDIYQLAVEKFHGVPEGWKWCKLDKGSGPEGFTEVVGAVPVGVYRSGPRKGLPKWPKENELQTFWVSKEERQATIAEWEKTTGKCHRCEGEGRMLSGLNALGRRAYRACDNCGGGGHANPTR